MPLTRYYRESFAFYFEDPDGNMIEIYWPTGDLSQPDEVLLKSITATA